MAESIQDVFWMGTPGFESMLYVNPAFERIWGRSPQSLYEAPRSFMDSVHPDDREIFLGGMQKLLEEGTVFDAEYRILNADGAIRWVRNRAFPIRDECGKTYLVTGVARDITDRKASEESLKESESELRFLSSKLLSAQEEERKRLAVELHDSLGSTLTAVKISLENNWNCFIKGAADPALFETSIALTRTAIEDIRRIIVDLRPTTLDDLGLLATLEWFCRRFGTVYSSICVRKNVRVKEKQIPETLKTVIYRVIQESFNNIAKYSGAKNVKLSLSERSGELKLKIEDDGEGFDVATALSKESSRKGLGLTSMKERTEFSGGRFSILSIPGKGTTIEASWPGRT